MRKTNKKIGISALLFNINECLEICKENKEINHIEIGIDNISDCEELKKYEKEIKKLNLSVGIHLAMELNPGEDIKYIRDAWVNYVKIISNNLSYLKIEYYNMHLGYIMKNRLEKNREKYLKNIVDFFSLLSKKTNSIPITIENTYTKGGDFCNLGTKLEDFSYIFKYNSNIEFCYDTGHNLINPDNYFLLKDKIKIVHFSDNNKKEDEHLGIMEKSLKISDIKNILASNAEFLVLEMKLNYIKKSLDIIKKLY